MIFLGDIACPDSKVIEFNKCIEGLEVFSNEIVVLNLEATFADEKQDFDNECLFNSKRVLDGFIRAKKVVVSLANNHMYDFPERIKPTIEYLKKNNIGVFGICEEDGDTFNPYVYKDSTGDTYAFFGHCWRLYTETNKNHVNDLRVVDHKYKVFIERVSQYVKQYPEQKVYCFMHWNYDLEKLPFPLHIKVARMLIDNGVYGVVGSHSHRPQGAEIYKEKPIVYGLGNFYLPSGVFFNGKLSYPDYSKDTYALSIKDTNYSIIWFRTDDARLDNFIMHNGTETFQDSRISEISIFRNLSDQEYYKYFCKNRVKKLLVPVFLNIDEYIEQLKEVFAILRVKILRKIL